jgi:two-component system chemotaxis sensor kinase CheA
VSDELNFNGGRPSDEMAEYLQLYLDETGEQLDALVETLLVLENHPHDVSHLNEAFRLIHSIKGSSAMMGLDSVAALTHTLENHFERLRSKLLTLDEPTFALILRCIDFLRECNERLRQGQALSSSAELLEELSVLTTGEERPIAEAHPATSAEERAPDAPISLPESRFFLVAVRFEDELPLVELKAELVVMRLAEVAEIRETDPGPREAHRLSESPWLQVLVVSDNTADELRQAADVEGVQFVEIVLDADQFRTAPAGEAAEAIATIAPAPEPAAEPLATPKAQAEAPLKEVASGDSDDSRGRVAETVRVDIDRLDKLMNLAGELVVNKARFVQIARQLGAAYKGSRLSSRGRSLGQSMRRALASMRDERETSGAAADARWREQLRELEAELAAIEEQSAVWEESRRGFLQMTEAIDQLTRVSDSLQRGVLETRMVPVAPLFNRFKRVVRDIAQELQKKVCLEVRGEKTELDKRMIDELGDPLVHLVRNAIDHGIESAKVRAERGKSEVGALHLEAAHSGNNVFISVRDDGGGLNADRIRRRVAERGLLSNTAAAALSDREAFEFIWHPGFSTAAEVSGISGRGVGMDIVKTRIAELNGTIDVDSTAGKGTTFTIRLPLTLAIIRSLLFGVRYGVFAAPIDNVREIVAAPADRIVTIHGRRTFDNRGEFLPLVDIDDVFDWPGNAAIAKSSAGEIESRRRIEVVILQAAGRSMGLVVDELHGGQDIVIKSLAENFTHIRGLSGASILGDGSVCLLLDVAAAIDLATSPGKRPATPV